MKLRNIGYAAFIAATTAAFVIGSGGASEAKGKKKEAAPPQQTLICFGIGGPVCAEKGGQKFTYANACWAAREGAKVVGSKACPAPKAAKAPKTGGKKKADKKK